MRIEEQRGGLTNENSNAQLTKYASQKVNLAVLDCQY